MDREKIIKEYEEFVDKYECFSSSDDYVLEMHKVVLALLKESVSQGVVDQIRWERDTALSQLKEIGKGLGSKMDDIVALLKEQEAVEPKQVDLYGNDEWWGLVCICPDCNAEWMTDKANTHFCPNCGRSVKWE